MEDQYGVADLRQFFSGGNFFPPPELLSANRGFSAAVAQPYSMFASAGVHGNNGGVARTGSTGDLIEFKMDAGGDCGGGGGTVRWPRQETLALLEIRSRMDSKFKEANQKGPLWEEVARLMFEEHGYQRCGKKCREKFENLYKYYKKTKEGKAGRQDGKHYRFFRQLEALYGGGESSNSGRVSEANFVGFNQFNSPNKTAASLPDHHHECYNMDPKMSTDTSIISLSGSFNSDTTSSDYYNDLNVDHVDAAKAKKLRKGGKKRLKDRIQAHVEEQMREVVERQEAWMERMMRAIESKEEERITREEQWRMQEAAWIEQEHRSWAKERSWIRSRDASLMEAIHKLTGDQTRSSASSSLPNQAIAIGSCNNAWPLVNQYETNRFIQGKFGGQGSVDGVEHSISLNSLQQNDGTVNEGLFRYFFGENSDGRVI